MRHLKINQNYSLLDLHGRPMPLLSEGEPIRELI
jgi:hypothetical protein